MVHVPHDIWLYIAQFIPPDDLRDLISLNSAFFDIAMNARYREVSINYKQPRTAARLARLMDPAVARRVHHLNINPFFDQDYVHNWEKSNKDGFWRRGVRNVMKLMRDERTEDGSSGKFRGYIEETIRATIDALSGMSNVTEFTVEWVLTSSGTLQSSILPAAWNAFGAKLKKLSVGGTLENVRALLSSAPRLAIEEFNMEFTDNILVSNNEVDTLLHVVAPFINDLRPTLQGLYIFSRASLDLSSFFNKLGTFPTLQRTSLHLIFNKAFKQDTSGLSRFLHDHSETLQHVDLRLNPSGAMMNPSSENTFVNWMAETTADELILANLQSLKIYPALLPGGFDSFIVYLQRSADTLTSLVVRDRYLLYDEVDAIASVFSHRPPSKLKALRLNVRTLSPRLIDLLATKLPGLVRLSLYLGDGRDAAGAGGGGAPLEEPVVTMAEFRKDMRKRKYDDWSLYDIGFWQGGNRVEKNFMMLMSECVPSVRTFWGYVAVKEAMISSTSTLEWISTTPEWTPTTLQWIPPTLIGHQQDS